MLNGRKTIENKGRLRKERKEMKKEIKLGCVGVGGVIFGSVVDSIDTRYIGVDNIGVHFRS